MIDIIQLSVQYNSISALRDINLHISPGECVLITGPSGCGKSTLARVMSGLIPHAIEAQIEGQVRVAGLDVRDHRISELAQRVGTVFQNPSSQLFHLRVDDEAAFGVRNVGLSDMEVQERTDWALRAVGLGGFEARRPAELSGGEKQRLAIAAALAMGPKVLVLDEPTASLDVPGTRQIMSTLRMLQERENLTLVLIEQRLAEALRLADRLILMAEGEILADDRPDQILRGPGCMRGLGLRRPQEEPAQAWERLLIPDGRAPSDAEAVLDLKDVTAGYGNKRVIEGIHLTLYQGEFAALVGDNGAGKSTLGLVASGLLKPQKGQVRYQNGHKPRGGLDVAMLFQNPMDQLFTDRVKDEVAFGPHNFRRFDPHFERRILEETDLYEFRNRHPMRLSAGQQQRTALASCLALKPSLLILDEPTLGQDWGHLEQLMDLLGKLNQNGTTILLITHDYKLIYRYASRVILMDGGQIMMEGKLRKVKHR